MQSASSPFGPFTTILATVVAVAVVGATLVIHALAALGICTVASQSDVQFLDLAAGAVLALLFGTAYGVRIGGNGAVTAATQALAVAQAAHTRLDAIAAPAAAMAAEAGDDSAPI